MEESPDVRISPLAFLRPRGCREDNFIREYDVFDRTNQNIGAGRS